MKFLQIGIYDDDIPVLCYNEEQWQADRKRIYYAVLGLSTLWRSWFRHCATSRKVAGSIPDGFIQIFHSHSPSGRTMALGLIQTNKNEYQEYFLGVKVAGA